MKKVKGAGYARISKDEQKKDYATIQAQIDEITKYCEVNNIELTKIYIDDGISGYKFNREGLTKLLDDMDKNEFQVIIAKDLSRIGRHNAYTLLLLEEITSKGKRLITLSDNTDTDKSNTIEGDFTGIKTLMNELYVKDLSRKIRFNLKSYQEKNTYLNNIPYGYKKDEVSGNLIIDTETSKIVQRIFQLYLEGNGIWKIANILTSEDIDTPTEYARKEAEKKGKIFKTTTKNKWYDGTILHILKNDCYMGVKRHRKTIREGIHGKIRWTKENEQIIFKNNHPSIISENDFNLVQEMIEKRKNLNYRGSVKYENPFSGYVFCEDCSAKLIARNQKGRPKCYVCSTYKDFGKKSCSSHHIREDTLNFIIIEHIKLLQKELKDVLLSLNNEVDKKLKTENNYNAIIRKTEQEVVHLKAELKVLLNQKIKAIVKNPDNEDMITEQYSELEKEKTDQISMLEKQVIEFKEMKEQTESFGKNVVTANSLLQDIIDRGVVSKKDLQYLVNKIVVDKNGEPKVYLKDNIEYLFNKHREMIGEQVNIVEINKIIKYLANYQEDEDKMYKGVS